VKFLIWLVVNAGALAVATWLLDGMRLTGSSDTDRILTLLIVALIFGVINAVLGPVIKLLSLPFIILTLGLLLLVINALLLMLTSAICGALDVPFQVDGFGTAVLGSIIITIASWILEAVLPDGD
jgi:putative membrane protein